MQASLGKVGTKQAGHEIVRQKGTDLGKALYRIPYPPYPECPADKWDSSSLAPARSLHPKKSHPQFTQEEQEDMP